MKLLEDAGKGEIGEPISFTGGLATVYCWGAFSGAQVKLHVSPDKTNWFDVQGFTFTTTALPKNLNIAECWMMGEVVGGDGSTKVNLIVKHFSK